MFKNHRRRRQRHNGNSHRLRQLLRGHHLFGKEFQLGLPSWLLEGRHWRFPCGLHPLRFHLKFPPHLPWPDHVLFRGIRLFPWSNHLLFGLKFESLNVFGRFGRGRFGQFFQNGFWVRHFIMTIIYFFLQTEVWGKK